MAEGDNPPDVAIIEIGGTVGDIEGLPFLEAIRQLKSELGRDNCLNIHLTLVPYLKSAGEHKTKPTNQSNKQTTLLLSERLAFSRICEILICSQLNCLRDEI